LAFEGTVTEKKYFEDLRNSEYFNDSGKIELISIDRPKEGHNSPKYVKDLLSKTKRDYNFRPTDEFWMIIDRDDWEAMHSIDFSELYESCKQEKNLFIALSNPCFEIWLIFHFVKLSDIGEEDKKQIYQNRSISKKKHFIDQYLANVMGTGRGYNKRPNPNIFMPRVKDAIINAKESRIEEEEYPKTIGTDVYKLVEKLVK